MYVFSSVLRNIEFNVYKTQLINVINTSVIVLNCCWVSSSKL